LYYAISLEHTDFHPLYGEAINKSFLAPIKINVLVDWEGFQTTTTNIGIDRRPSITVHFHRRRLTEDQDLYIRVGDFILYGETYYEIINLNEPKQLYGSSMNRMEISAKCIKARDGVFNAK
jgi:hypothetical protein